MGKELKKPLFSKDFYYPNQSNPQFMVSSIEAGYKFKFYNPDGTERVEDSFSIGAATLDNPQTATGYDGEKGNAIEIFRQSMKP